MQQYTPGKQYEFEVRDEFGSDEPFFRLKIDGAPDFRLNKLKFQTERPLPKTLKCLVKNLRQDGTPFLSHFIPQYVNQLYAAGNARGEEWEFKVIEQPSTVNGNAVVEDKFGIRYKVSLPDGEAAALGNTVICRFAQIQSHYFSLVPALRSRHLRWYNPRTLLEAAVQDTLTVRLILLYIDRLDEFAAVRDEISSGNPRWPLSALAAAMASLDGWVRSGWLSADIHSENLLAAIKHLALYLIEESDYLGTLPAPRRRSIQQELTQMTERLKPYRRACNLMRGGGADTFISGIVDRLKASGYLYHPEVQLATMMAIMRTRPELTRLYLGGILESILEWDLGTWTAAPFRSAFIGQFEIYIREASRDIDRLPQASTDEAVDRIEKTVTAIALQILIDGGENESLLRHNRSLFYRYISLLRPQKSDVLLDKSFLMLTGAKLPLEFCYDDIKELAMLLTKASVAPDAAHNRLQSVFGVEMNGIGITVGPQGIDIRRADERTDEKALPSGMLQWLTPTVSVKGVKSLPANRLNSFDAHARLWVDIENALTRPSDAPPLPPLTKRIPDIDDEVTIIIDSKRVGGNELMWRCRTDDDAFEDTDGVIYGDEIATYLSTSDFDRNQHILSSAFSDADGNPLRFRARVVAIDEDEVPEFSLLDLIDARIGDILNYNDEYEGVVTHETSVSDLLVLTSVGIGVFTPKEDGYGKGDAVTVRMTDIGQRRATITGDINEPRRTDRARAFVSLMQAIAETEPRENDDNVYDGDTESLTREDIMQLAQMFRFKALATGNLMEAYDYLRFGRLLAIAAGDDDTARELATHAELLRLHQSYAANSRIDSDALESLRPCTASSPMLDIIFHRLEIVSWMGDGSHDQELWATVNSPRNDLESRLARLVLGFNLLSGDDTETYAAVRKDLKSQIAALLDVNFDPHVPKTYGSENQFVEFKSSIVYPARKNRNDTTEADPEKQQFVLLKTMAGFMNASGGTLYIGVNNATRAEAGLFEDFEYYKRRKARIGAVTYDIHTADNVVTFLTNLVRDRWGALVSESIQISVDDEARHDVVMVKVQPRTTPVLLDGKIFVRRSDSTIALGDADARTFAEERMKRRKQIATYTEEPEPETAIASEPEVVVAPTPAEPEPEPFRIPTSLWRPNILHDAEDGFVTPEGYLYFEGPDSLYYSPDDYYLEQSLPLVLQYSPMEADSGYLLLLYPAQRVLKVPMSEILDKDSRRPMPLYNVEKPIFATICLPGDGLLTIISDSKGNLSRRVTPVNDIPATHLRSTPERLLQLSCDETVAAELVAAESIDRFAESTSSELSGRQIGYTLKCRKDQPQAEMVIAESLRMAAANN